MVNIGLTGTMFSADPGRATATRVVAVVGVLCAALGGSSTIGARADALSELGNDLDRYHSVDLNGIIRTEVVRVISKDELPTIEETVLCVRRLGSRALISRKTKSTRSNSKPVFTQNDLVLLDNGDVLSCQADLDTSLSQLSGITDNLMFMLYSRRLAGTQNLDASSIYDSLNDGGAALWVIGYAPLREYIDAGKTKATVTDDGAEIGAETENGSLVLKLSKAHGWLPRSFRLIKTPEDRTIGGRVRDVYSGKITSVTWDGEVTEFQNDPAGHWFPKRCKISRTTSRPDAPDGKIETTITLNHLVYDPPLSESDFRSEIVVPVNFPVTVDGAAHLPYRWNGNAVVSGAPELPGRTPIVDSPSGIGMRRALVFLNIILVIVLLALIWKKRSTVSS